jgi:proline dehydrogenase
MNLGRKVLGKRLFNWIIRNTFYAQFVAGENEIAIRPVINNLRSFGVKSILDYSAEEDVAMLDTSSP